MNLLKGVAAVVFVMMILAGCASSPDSTDSWSRSYLLPLDRVFDAAVDVLEDEGYLVDAERQAGRISAEPSRSRSQRGPTMVVRVEEKNGRARVDVQTRMGAERSTTTSSGDGAAVLEFLFELDQRLREPAD